MKDYVVGFISFFDNELVLKKVQAKSEVEAIKNSGFVDGYEFAADADVESIQDTMFNCDSVVSVMEI